MENISFFWVFLIIITCGFGAILYLLVTHESKNEKTKIEPSHEENVNQKLSLFKDLTERQKNILAFLEEKKMAKPPELREIAGNVSSRTVRRDMDVLVKKGLVSQEGTTKSTYYKYVAK